MADYSDRIAWLRYHVWLDDPSVFDRIADALEAQAKEIAELKSELASEQDRADRIAREWDALRWEQEASVKYSTQLRKSLKETLAVAERNELGGYQLRARAALKGEK